MATAFIIDPALRGFADHHQNAVVGWVDAAHICGLDVRILAHRECLLDAIEIFPIEKIFASDFYDTTVSLDPENVLRRLQSLRREFRDCTVRALAQVCSDDVVILNHANLATLNGIGAWASGQPRQHLPRLVVWMQTAPEDDEYAIAFASTNCVVAAIDRLRSVFTDRLILLGATADITKRYNSLHCGWFNCLPYIALRRQLMPRQTLSVGSPPIVAVLGDFWLKKGPKMLPSVIRRIAEQAIDVRWMIAGRFGVPSSMDLLGELENTDGNVDLIGNAPDNGDYDDRLRSADLFLLCYSPVDYARRGSEIAEEAEVLGIPYAAPKVGFSEAAAAAGAAKTFEEWTADAIVMALSSALRDLPDLSRRAQHLARKRLAEVREVRQTVLHEALQNCTGSPQLFRELSPNLPAVDIIVTLRNCRRFLRSCLTSIANQSYPNWRCIVVDDNSNDIRFQELRSVVADFGDRFTAERHASTQGQINAVATGLSLGSSPFIVLVDADVCLAKHALDLHMCWHLNGKVPVAMTSGRMLVVDEHERLLAGTMDNLVSLHFRDCISRLSVSDAYRRPQAGFEPSTASFVDQSAAQPGEWFWAPTSGMMFRRSIMELVLPSHHIGIDAAGTYFAWAAHLFGGSILIDEVVARYRRHGSNFYAGTAVFGAGTTAVRSVAADWRRVAEVLRIHIENTKDRFVDQIAPRHIDRVLHVLALPHGQEMRGAATRDRHNLSKVASRGMLAEVLASSSWKLTRPMREFGKRFPMLARSGRKFLNLAVARGAAGRDRHKLSNVAPRDTLAEVLASSSWKLTRPMREFGNRFPMLARNGRKLLNLLVPRVDRH